MPCGHQKGAEYLYATADARVAFGVCRCTEKCFRQWRPDLDTRSGRRWGIRIQDRHGNVVAKVPALPYMLPQLLAAVADDRLVWITEGEKDVRALVAAGLTATCNAEGAGKWTPAHAAYLKGADVRIVADRDDAGRRHALQVVESLMPLARSIDVVQARHGKDAHDHLAAGGDPANFVIVGEPKPLLVEAAA
jgi:DNA primase